MELYSDLPAPEPGPKIQFWTPKNARPETIICVSSIVWAHYVHWLGKRTSPCELVVGKDGEVRRSCEDCNGKNPRRWKGYLHVIRGSTQEHEFLCLTPNAGFEVQGWVKKGQTLRGLRLDVWRVRGQATAALIVRRNENLARLELSIPELDPGKYLDTVFRRRKPLDP